MNFKRILLFLLLINSVVLRSFFSNQSALTVFIASSAACVFGAAVAGWHVAALVKNVVQAKKNLVNRGLNDSTACSAYRLACRQLGVRSGLFLVSHVALLSVALRAACLWKTQQLKRIENRGADEKSASLVELNEAKLVVCAIESAVANQEECVSLQKKITLKSCAYMYALCYAGAVEELKAIVNLRAVLYTAEQANFPCPLDAAVQNNFLDVAEILLKAGVNTERFNYRTGNTPLLAAVVSGCPAMVELLLKYGASVKALNIDTQLNALQFAEVFYGEIRSKLESGDLEAYKKIIFLLKSAANITDSSCRDEKCPDCHD